MKAIKGFCFKPGSINEQFYFFVRFFNASVLSFNVATAS